MKLFLGTTLKRAKPGKCFSPKINDRVAVLIRLFERLIDSEWEILLHMTVH